MKLYYAESPNPRKACAVAKHLDIPVSYELVDLQNGQHRSPAYLAINPNGKVPALQDGDRSLFESNAIMVYLAQKAGSDLWSDDPSEQVELVKWMSWDLAHFTRHGGQLFFQNFIKPQFGFGDPDVAIVEESTGYFRQFAAILDDHLRGRDFVFGERLTVADFALATMLPFAGPSKIPVGDFAQVSRWHDGLLTLPAWSSPFPAQGEAAAA